MLYDCVVVGAGIEGSSTAYQLLKRGTERVLLLEQVPHISFNFIYRQTTQ